MAISTTKNIGFYFSLSMAASGMIMTVAKLEIIGVLGAPSFLGVLSSISVATILTFDLLFSYIFDQKSRRLSALLANIFLILFCLLLFDLTPITILALSVSLGLANALMSGVIGAMTMEHTPDQAQRFKTLSRIEVAVLFSTFCGNLIGIFLYSINSGFVWAASIVILTSTSLLTFYLLPRNKEEHTKIVFNWGEFKQIFLNLVETYQDKTVFILSIIARAGFMALQTYWIVYFLEASKSVENLWLVALTSSSIIIAGIFASTLGALFSLNWLKYAVLLLSVVGAILVMTFFDNVFIYTIALVFTIITLRLSQQASYIYYQNKISNKFRSTFSSIVSTAGSLLGIIIIVIMSNFIDSQTMASLSILMTVIAIIPPILMFLCV